MEQLDYNLLFRWFVGLSADDPVWDATVFCKNRDQLLNGDIARKFMTTVLNLPQVRSLLSSEHFSVDGTLIEAWASMKSFGAEGWQPSAIVRKWQRRWRWAQRRARLPWRETRECHAFLDDRSRRPIVSKKRRQGGQARSHGAPDDGEPQRAHRRCPADRGQRHGRAHDRAKHDRRQCQARQHRGRRQEL